MANESSAEDNFNTIVVGAIATTLVLLLILPMIFVAGKTTYYSAYSVGGDSEIEQYAQVTDMRGTLADDEGYFIGRAWKTNKFGLHDGPFRGPWLRRPNEAISWYAGPDGEALR